MTDSATQSDVDVTQTLEYAADSSTIASARADTAAWATGAGAHDEVVDQLMLIVSELASNAIEAGGDDYSLALTESDAHWTVAVSNDAMMDAIPPRHDWVPSDVLAERGRGLSIVDALSSHVVVAESAGRLTVTAQLDR